MGSPAPRTGADPEQELTIAAIGSGSCYRIRPTRQNGLSAVSPPQPGWVACCPRDFSGLCGRFTGNGAPLSAIVDAGREDKEYVITPWSGPINDAVVWFATVTLPAWAPGQNPLTVSHQSRTLRDDVYIHRPDPKLAEGGA